MGGRGPSPGVLKQYPQIKSTTVKLLGDLLKEFRAFWGFSGKAEREGSLPSKMVRFLIFSQKIFVWIPEPPISDLGGRGRSPGELKQYPQIKPTAAKLLGNLLKEFRAFSGFLDKTEKEGSWPSNLHRF